MMQKYLFQTFILAFLSSACSSTFQAGADRQPAAKSPPVPYVPGVPNANNHGASNSPGTPAVPPKRDPGPPPRGQQRPRDNNGQRGPEDLATCEPPIANWRFAYSEKTNYNGTFRTEYSVLDALLNGAGARGQITESKELDRSILRDWIGKGLERNSDVFQSAQSSTVYQLAFDYVNTSEDTHTQRGPSSSAAPDGRLAVYLATLIAVSENLECVRTVMDVGTRMLSDINLSPKGAFEEFNRSVRNYIADAQLGKARQRFVEFDSNQRKFENDLRLSERQVRLQQEAVDRNTKNFENILQKQARSIENLLRKNSVCAGTPVNIQASTAMGDIEFLNSRVQNCISASEQRIARFEEKKADLEKQNKEDSGVYRDTIKNLELWQDALGDLTGDRADSAPAIIEKMRNFAKTYTDIQTQINELQAAQSAALQNRQRLQQISTPWLTHGYLGNFLR